MTLPTDHSDSKSRENPAVNPLTRLARLRRCVTALGLVLMAGAGVWAFWLLATPTVDSTIKLIPPKSIPEEDDSDYQNTSALDHDVFAAATLWNPLPPPIVEPEPEKAAVIVRRPNLELIGIIEENNQYLAALYDPDNGELRIVKSGDRIEPFTIADISAETVRLEDGEYIAHLVVHDEGESP